MKVGLDKCLKTHYIIKKRHDIAVRVAAQKTLYTKTETALW